MLTLAAFWLLAGGLGLSRASAFSEPRIYGESADKGGGAGRYFTGSPADGYGCSACHTGQGSLPLRVTGVPVDGYVPGRSYVVHLAWPEAAARANVATAMGLRPSIGLTAEFVAEDGSDSGKVDIEPMFAMAGEFCASTDLTAPRMLAAQLYQTDPSNVENAPSLVTSCSGSVRNQRCIATIRSCGSSELRLRWTAPPKWRGPIWFSAGFVMTDNASTRPNDFDFVTEVSSPMNAASIGESYESDLESGCSAVPGRPAAGSGIWLFATLLLGLSVFRRSPRLVVKLATLVGLMVVGAFSVGCADDGERMFYGASSDNVGLFTPGYSPSVGSGQFPSTAEDGGAAGKGAPPTSLQCMGVDFEVAEDGADAGPPPAGNLMVNLTTDAPMGIYDKVPGDRLNYGAIWIEDEQGKYVRGLALWRGLFFLQLPMFVGKRMRLACPEADVIASATARMHQTKMLQWDGKNTKGDVVPDGKYVLWVEVQVDEHELPAASYSFEKGRSPWTNTFPPASPPQSMLTLTYKPLD